MRKGKLEVNTNCIVVACSHTRERVERGIVAFLGRNFIKTQKIIMDESHAGNIIMIEPYAKIDCYFANLFDF